MCGVAGPCVVELGSSQMYSMHSDQEWLLQGVPRREHDASVWIGPMQMGALLCHLWMCIQENMAASADCTSASDTQHKVLVCLLTALDGNTPVLLHWMYLRS